MDSPYATGGLEAGRDAVMIDLGASIPQYSVRHFIDNILPPLRQEVDVGGVVAQLRKNRTILKNGRWKWFKEDPTDMKMLENAAFKPLEELANAIAQASGLGEKSLHFQNNPNRSPESENRKSTSRPDGYFILSGGREKPHWRDIALSAEYKLHNTPTDRYDDVVKVVWSMHQCMREDPRRRFTYGVTIENTNMKLWFSSRGGLIVSRPFNFIEDHNSVVEFFLRFMYAEEREAGWDPTITRVVPTDSNASETAQPCYDITVKDENGEEVIYRTTAVLSDTGANPLRGRGTRVWVGRKLVNDAECGDPVVIKDIWIDSDRKREGYILQELREVKPKGPEEVPLATFLLTVLCHGDVWIDGKPDDTKRPIQRTRREAEPAADFSLEGPIPLQNAAGAGTGSHLSLVEHTNRQNKRLVVYNYLYKTHYRIVFAEVCDTLHKLTSLKDIFNMLGKAVIGLQGLHLRGYIHRDISTGNLLIHKGGLKLSDFEYTKPMDEVKGHEIRTGTADFIAVEVEKQEYMFSIIAPPKFVSKPDRHARVRTAFKPDDQPDHKGAPETPSTSDPSESDVFRYNPLHDLESVWWIGNHFVFDKRVAASDESGQSKKELLAQMELAADLFYNRSKRDATLMGSGVLKGGASIIHRSIRGTIPLLEKIRDRLHTRYREVEIHPNSIGPSVANEHHIELAFEFMAISDILNADIHITAFDKFDPHTEPGVHDPLPQVDSPSTSQERQGQSEEHDGTDLHMQPVAGPSRQLLADNLRDNSLKRSNASVLESKGSDGKRGQKRKTSESKQSAEAQETGPHTTGTRRSARQKRKLKRTSSGSQQL